MFSKFLKNNFTILKKIFLRLKARSKIFLKINFKIILLDNFDYGRFRKKYLYII